MCVRCWMHKSLDYQIHHYRYYLWFSNPSRVLVCSRDWFYSCLFQALAFQFLALAFLGPPPPDSSVRSLVISYHSGHRNDWGWAQPYRHQYQMPPSTSPYVPPLKTPYSHSLLFINIHVSMSYVNYSLIMSYI